MEIRPFGATVQDARGIIEVDRETFGDCTYVPAQILSLLAGPQQYAWVAMEDGLVAGFVSRFVTSSLAAARWEVDELAVRPAYQGRGIGTRLVAHATPTTEITPGVSEARALVARSNVASQRAFQKNGFSPTADVDLLLYEVSGRVPRPEAGHLPDVRPATDGDLEAIAALTAQPVSRVADRMVCPANTYLVAMRERHVVGLAELVHVHTLQYEGFWIESLSMSDPDLQVAKALFGAAIREAKQCQTVDRVGYLAPPEERVVYDACVGEGFHRIDAYNEYVRRIDSR